MNLEKHGSLRLALVLGHGRSYNLLYTAEPISFGGIDPVWQICNLMAIYATRLVKYLGVFHILGGDPDLNVVTAGGFC